MPFRAQLHWTDLPLNLILMNLPLYKRYGPNVLLVHILVLFPEDRPAGNIVLFCFF